MTDVAGPAHAFTSFDHARSCPRFSPWTMAGAAVFAVGLSAGAWHLDGRPVVMPDAGPALHVEAATPVVTVAVIAPQPRDPLLVAAFSLGVDPLPLADSAPLPSRFQLAEATPVGPIVATADIAPVPMPTAAVMPTPAPVVADLVETVPLPMPRPPEFRQATSEGPPRVPSRQFAQRSRAPLAAPADNRTFFEKLFGAQPQPPGPVLAYAAPETGLLSGTHGFSSSAMAPHDHSTAVYDIAAHTVYMPNGETLEAHSGLGDKLDDPRHVAERNRGATPPQVYDLEPRAQLFHGVRALRLNPVGGGGTFGRNGLLAHSYMLGPNGDSNGCVSFKNYNAFLQAYSRGEVTRLTVVARRT